MSTDRIYLATLDSNLQVPSDQLGNAPSGSGVPAWAASTAYTAGQQRSNAGQIYVALLDHTSGSSFDTSKWSLVGVLDGGTS